MYEIQFRPTGENGNTDGLLCLPRQGVTPKSTSVDTKIFSLSQVEAFPVTVHQLCTAIRADRTLSKVFYLCTSTLVIGSCMHCGHICVLIAHATHRAATDTVDRDSSNAFAVFRSFPSSDK